MKIKCSLCNMVFDDEDELIHQRKSRHEMWHDANTTSYRRNAIIGKVEWHDANNDIDKSRHLK